MLIRKEGLLVVPAVDVLDDEAVRLAQGDFERVTTRAADPADLAERLVGAGAELVHLVDLSAARAGRIRPQLVRRVVSAAAPAHVQAAGGIRSPADASALLDAGASRVVVGTAAFEREDALDELVAELRDRLVVAIDVRDGKVAVDGWVRTTALGVDEAVDRCVAAGVRRLLCTAIERDGTLAGPAVDLLGHVCARSGLPVLAAGGVRSLDDLAAVERAGCEGAIVGRALLEGRLPLSVLAGARRQRWTAEGRATESDLQA